MGTIYVLLRMLINSHLWRSTWSVNKSINVCIDYTCYFCTNWSNAFAFLHL